MPVENYILHVSPFNTLLTTISITYMIIIYLPVQYRQICECYHRCVHHRQLPWLSSIVYMQSADSRQ